MKIAGSANCLFALAAPFLAAGALAATHSFDQNSGVLSVDYAGYLSKHAVVFNRPITDSTSGLTVGNGCVGAMVWNSNGITMQITGADASEQACFSQGCCNLSTSPRMDSNYATFQQYLSLYDGTVTTKYDNNRTVTILGQPQSEVLGIHVEDGRTGVKSATFQIKMWDPNMQITSAGTWNSMMSDVPDINTWKTVTSFSDSTSAGISRGQTDANHFGYSLAASVEGAGFTAKQIDNRTVQIQITPTSSYTIWIACASRINSPGNDSRAHAAALLSAVKAAGYAPTLTAFVTWWHTHWAKSFVQYSNSAGDADYLENIYYLCSYMLAAGSYGNYPFHFVNGVFKHNADLGVIWSGGYWYWDNRNVYNHMLASNHPDEIGGFYRLFFRNLATLKSFTMSRFSIDGAWTPETMGWDGNARWTTSSTYTDRIYTTSIEAASNMFMRFAYTCDTAFLRDTAYPFMKETAKFYSSMLSFDQTAKQYYMANSNCHETYWGVKNAITDLAAVRSFFPQAILSAKLLGLDSAMRVHWQGILDSLVPFKTQTVNGAVQYMAYDPPTVAASNSENVACEILWSYGVTGIGAPDYQIALNTFNNRPFPYKNPIMPCAVQAARLGLGDNTFNGIKTFLAMSQTYPNGLGSMGGNGGSQSFDFAGLHQLYINESLLQSYSDTIRVFPAPPGDATFNGKFTLLARGAFLVSSEKQNGDIEYVGIKSLAGSNASVYNPWPSQQVQVRKTSDNSIVATTSGATIRFSTAANQVYVVERTAKLLSTFTFARLSGTPNGSVKTMAYNGSTLTLGAGQGNPPVSSVTAIRPAIAQPCLPRTVLAANGRIFLQSAGAGSSYSLEIFSLAGELVRKASSTAHMVDFKKDLGLSRGAYVVRIVKLQQPR